MKLAIRDDDMNFFTKVEDIEKVYADMAEIPVSFAVIPTVTDVSTVGNCPDTRGNVSPKDVLKNDELIAWLKTRLKEGRCDVLLHGITHGYKFIEGKRYAEMQWREEPDLKDELAAYRKSLSEALDYNVSCFVAPSNKISKYGIQCVAEVGMNFSGIVPITFDRDATFRNALNYMKRWWLRLVTNLPYPGVLTYSDHKELNACLLNGFDYLVKMYKYCQKTDNPMVVNVHYWHLRDNPAELKMLTDFVHWALEQGAEPARLSDILNMNAKG